MPSTSTRPLRALVAGPTVWHTRDDQRLMLSRAAALNACIRDRYAAAGVEVPRVYLGVFPCAAWL